MNPFITGSEMKLARKPRRRSPATSAAIPTVSALVIAREIGQVRAILDKEHGPRAIEIYPSVRAAVDALRAEG